MTRPRISFRRRSVSGGRPAEIAGGIDQDLKEPVAETAFEIAFPEITESPEKRFLGHLEGVFAVARHPVGQAEERPPVGKDQRLESRGVSGEHPEDQFFLLHVHITREYIPGSGKTLRRRIVGLVS